MKRCILVIASIISFACFSVPTQAAVVYADLIDMSFISTQWYTYTGGSTGYISFNDANINFQKQLHAGSVNYGLTGTFTFQSNLTRDYSSSNLARGYFDGNASVTIKGGLKLGASYIYGGTGLAAKTIFQANLIPVYEDGYDAPRWSLEEDPLLQGNFNRTLLLELVPASEGLASGIDLGNGDILKMSNQALKMDLSLKSQTVNDFTSLDLNSGGVAAPVRITALPEPATLLLLSLGAVLFRKRTQ